MMKLQNKLNELKEQFLSTAPAEAVSIMQKATADLIDSGIMDGVLQRGKVAPLFTLPDENGDMVSSESLLTKGPLVVCVYRGVW